MVLLLIYTFLENEPCWYDALEPVQLKKKRIVYRAKATAASSASPNGHCPKSAGRSIKMDLEGPKCSDGVVLATATPSQPADPSAVASFSPKVIADDLHLESVGGAQICLPVSEPSVAPSRRNRRSIY